MQPTTPARILVVEDDTAMQTFLYEALANEGYEATLVDTGALALEALLRVRPHALLLDLGLPDMGGLEVGRHVRAAYGDAMPIVIISASQRLHEYAAMLRASDCLAKPFDLSDLFMAMQRAVAQVAGKPPAPLPLPCP